MLKLPVTGNAAESIRTQPPSGGCVLKLTILAVGRPLLGQPPSGGCVLKLGDGSQGFAVDDQPPSGGCVLKHVQVGA